MGVNADAKMLSEDACVKEVGCLVDNDLSTIDRNFSFGQQ